MFEAIGKKNFSGTLTQTSLTMGVGVKWRQMLKIKLAQQGYGAFPAEMYCAMLRRCGSV